MPKLPKRLPEQLRGLARAARAAGWRIERRRSGHLAWIPPRGPRLFTSSTPSDRRSVRNDVAMLRRAGLSDSPAKRGSRRTDT
ncbi:hypothetical protein GCM10009799_03090 [Nocardiopsis rhodophaea]|uniref:Type II toxin-antitoxin system HicA family toxin n=1 Tax=Nocardiopsis rhodophaea TaxID=280238 RepID=A0ABN2S6Y9_9ACTN